MFANISKAFVKTYVSPEGKIQGDTQTAYVLALTIGLLPEELRAGAASRLAADVAKRGNHPSTGFVGTQWLWDALTATGHRDLAFALIEQTSYPSYGYLAGMGATTMWEAWNSLNPDGSFAKKRASLNHSALASAGDWMYRAVGGLAPDPAAPGFRHFSIAPRAEGTITSAATNYDSPYGPVAVAWKKSGSMFVLDAKVPPNTTATISVPCGSLAAVQESGRPAASAPGLKFLRMADGAAVFDAGSGVYHFESHP